MSRVTRPMYRSCRHTKAMILMAVIGVCVWHTSDMGKAQAETVVWNVKQRFDVTAAGLQQGIEEAKTHFQSHPDDTVVLEIDAGKYELKDDGEHKGTLVLSGIHPGANGRLVIRGKGMNETVLVFDDDKHGMYGLDVNRVTFADLHMTRDRLTISQGLVQSVGPGHVILKIDDGYPSPQDLYDASNETGRFLRRYKRVNGEPQMDHENNVQLAWHMPVDMGQGVWELKLNRPGFTPSYQPGDLIAVKSKRGGQAFWFSGGKDLRFERVKWTLKTRGKVRKDSQKIEMIDCVTDRTKVNGQWPCLASPEGGPQFGHPGDGVVTGVLISGCHFTGSGDDAIGLFEVEGRVENCVIQDAFARGIFVCECKKVAIVNVNLVRSQILVTDDPVTAPPE